MVIQSKKDISDTDESKRLEDAMDGNCEMYGEVWLKPRIGFNGLYSIKKKVQKWHQRYEI